MSSILLFPAANSVVQHTAFPIAGQNFASVNNYPFEPQYLSHIHNAVVPGTHQDSYTKASLLTLNYEITSLDFICSSIHGGAWPGILFTVEPLFIAGGVTTYGTAHPLTTAWAWFSYISLINPATGKPWTIADVNTITAIGLRSVTIVASACYTNNFYVKVNASIAGEYVTNSEPYLSDNIQVNQDYSILADSPASRNLLKCTIPKILYKLPSGVTGSLDAEVWDETKLLAKMPAATNVAAGKTLFKLSCTLPGGQLLEGDPFFANILSRWV